MTLFPTGKPHISFSELFAWKECPYRHKLLHIDKLGTFEPSPFLGFGTGVHASCEDYIETKTLDKSFAMKEIDEYWEENLEWKGVEAEEQLYESIQNDDMLFKGFIDAVIICKNNKGQRRIWLLDWKTAGWGWRKEKKQDFNYQMQLLLYKHFWSEKHNIDPKEVKTGFILLKRDGKNGKRCELVEVSGSQKKVDEAVKTVRSMLNAVRRGFFPKNYSACRWCELKGTEQCSGS